MFSKKKTIAQKIRENVGVDQKSAYVMYEWPLDWEDELPDDDCDLSHAHSMFSELRLLSSLTTDPDRLIITNQK